MANNLNELSAVYLQQIAEVELEQGTGPAEQQARVTQIVKAVRYRARKEGVELSKAYNDYIGSVQATSTERQAVKEKLGLTGGAAHKEEFEAEAKDWISGAIKKPGALKRELGVPEDETIPASKLKAAAKKGGKLGQRARLAVTLKGLNKEEVEIEESGVGYEAGKPAEKLGAVAGIPKSEQEAARERIRAKMAAKKAAKKVTEEFLGEVSDEPTTDKENDRKITEKKVKNKIVINPPMKEAFDAIGGTILEVTECAHNTKGEECPIHGKKECPAIEEDTEFGDIVESVYDELIEEGYTEDEIEYGIEGAIETLDEGYYDSAVATSKAKSQPAQVSLKDRLKSAAKKAIVSTARTAGKAMKAKAAVQAAPTKAKSKVSSLADRVKSAARAGYKSGRGPEAPSAAHTKTRSSSTYRGAGVGTKEKIGEEIEQVDEAMNAATNTQMQNVQRRQLQLDRKKLMIRKKMMAQNQQSPADSAVSSEEVEHIDEKLNLKKADMGDVVKDFYKSDAPQFKGKTKKERQKMAIAAKLSAERGER